MLFIALFLMAFSFSPSAIAPFDKSTYHLGWVDRVARPRRFLSCGPFLLSLLCVQRPL